MRRIRATGLLLAIAGLVVAAAPGAAGASPFVPLGQVESSAINVYAGCPPDGAGVNFPDSEVEPWLEVNPTNPDNLATFYQQDRYSNGGAKSNAAGVSIDAGATWTQVSVPQNTRCTDGGEYERASDPWISFSPNGVLHSMSLVTDPDPPSGGFGDNGMVANRSFDGGQTWEASKQLIADDNPRFLNDKNSMTADPNNSAFVYAVWDRLQQAGGDVQSPENRRGLGFKGPIYFTRSTEQRSDVRGAAQDPRDGREQADDRQSDRRGANEPGRVRCSTSSTTSRTRRTGSGGLGLSSWRSSGRMTTAARGQRYAAPRTCCRWLCSASVA